MHKRTDLVLLADIIDSINPLMDFTKGQDFSTFIGDLKTQYAADRCFEII